MSDATSQSTNEVPDATGFRGWVGRHPGWTGMTVILLAGGAARVALSLRDGHLPDVNLFLAWTRSLVENGLGRFHSGPTSCNYPPLYLLILRGLGELMSRLGIDLGATDVARAWMRLPACLADAVIAVLLFIETRRRFGPRLGVGAAALYFLNPAVLYNSAYWGQVDSIHSACVVGAVMALNRRRWTWAGAAIGLGLLQKFQAIVIVPLVIFEVYRFGRGRGLVRMVVGAAVVAGIVLTPFVTAGAAGTVLRRGYVNVVGQYNQLSVNAFNLYYLTGTPQAPGDSVPSVIVQAVAGGEYVVRDDASWLMVLTWRKISLVLFALMVAWTLVAHSRRSGPSARALTAGVLSLVFFMFLTEMHERYAFPALAVLPLWAIAGRWKERIYVVVSALILLNLAFVQPPDQIGADVSVLNFVLCLALLGMLALPRLFTEPMAAEDDNTQIADSREPEQPAPVLPLVRWFARVTGVVTIVASLVVGFVAFKYYCAPLPADHGALYLSELAPRSHRQGYGQLGQDRSVEGGVIRVGDSYYLKGLGTHAASRTVFNLPEGFESFRAFVGLNRHAKGRAEARVYLDGRRVFSSNPLTAGGTPAEIDIPLEGARQLTLETNPLGAIKGDHVDWALARLEP